MNDTGQPTVIVTPSSQSVEITHTATFIVTVKGVGPFKYQWHRGKHNLTNETQPTIVINEVSLKDQNYYRCYVSNNFGDSVLSNRVYLQVTSEYSYLIMSDKYVFMWLYFVLQKIYQLLPKIPQKHRLA